jgi:hypothetical protein
VVLAQGGAASAAMLGVVVVMNTPVEIGIWDWELFTGVVGTHDDAV